MLYFELTTYKLIRFCCTLYQLWLLHVDTAVGCGAFWSGHSESANSPHIYTCFICFHFSALYYGTSRL